MSNITQALFYFPTTVLLVDDDSNFLSNFGFMIDQNIPLKLCDTPHKALEILRLSPKAEDIINKSITSVAPLESGDTNLFPDYIMRADIKNLHEYIYYKSRFSCISTLLVDYSMPGMDGDELCRQLENNPVKKIMLTGVADYSRAIKWFNSGIIDHFIVKESNNMSAELNQAICKCKKAYFEKSSLNLLSYITKMNSCFDNIKYFEFIHKFFMENKFSEYYLIDSSGSMLFLDFQGNPTWIIIKSANEIEQLAEVSVENEAQPEIIKLLQTKKKIPFFFTDDDWRAPVSNWENYLHEALPIPGVLGHYFATIHPNTRYNLNKDKITSHKDYLLAIS
ncbi:MAG TPA: response regulator [Patescibacteria group bacterium]|nr:response regulator [Gammaproteobacteria bacterium]HWA51453.1 response regulator [Patescibacteria group bacterium]